MGKNELHELLENYDPEQEQLLLKQKLLFAEVNKKVELLTNVLEENQNVCREIVTLSRKILLLRGRN